MIVDDDSLVSSMLEHQLRQLGFVTCTLAGNGTEAGRILDQGQSFSVIFCDLKMSGMDGIEFLRYAAEKIPHVNVVLISSVDEKVMRAAAALAQAHQLKYRAR